MRQKFSAMKPDKFTLRELVQRQPSLSMLWKENLRSLTPDSFVIKKDANDGEYEEMTTSEKTKNHQGGLGDKGDKSDPKIFSTGKSNCPVKHFKMFLSVLNPNQTAVQCIQFE